MKKLFYTGVGSRKTPIEIQRVMFRLARKLAKMGYILRSGGADGADKAFENGADGKCEIFYAKDATKQAMYMASKFHPAWHRCSDYVQKLHGRNSFQVLGKDLNSASCFLICWTPDGAINHDQRSIRTGGTGTAISIASHFGVKVFNLARWDHLDKVKKFLTS